tara:strand:+ start:199 stop:426 length:228 start_codon:yes stop_codon:yes gene_type:complete
LEFNVHIIDYIIGERAVNVKKKKDYKDRAILKYCISCKNVYETKIGVDIKYRNFPSYKLKREVCQNCKKLGYKNC